MDKILRINENNEAELLREELELIPEFKTLLTLNYNKQPGDVDGRKRVRALKEFTYIWFMHSNYSPYREYDDKERHEEALLIAELPSTYPLSTELQLAIKKYKALNESRILKLIRAAEAAIDKIKDYFNSVDFTKETANGALVNKPTDVIRAIKELDGVSEGLEKLAARQKTEQNQFVSARGQQEVGWLMEQEKLNGNRNRDTNTEDN